MVGKRITAKKRDVVRRIVLKYWPEIVDEAKEWGVIPENAVIHHMFPLTKRYVANDRLSDTESEYIENVSRLNSGHPELVKKAKDIERERKWLKSSRYRDIRAHLPVEVDACVLLPSQFHNWLTGGLGNGRDHIMIGNYRYPLETRGDYYELWRRVRADRKVMEKRLSKP